MRREIWDIVPEELPWLKRISIRVLRFIMAVWRGFIHDDCSLHASALTYYTLMAIVPVLAMGLALGRVFGSNDFASMKIQNFLVARVAEIQNMAMVGAGAADTTVGNQPLNDFIAQFQFIIEQIFSQIEKVSFGALGGVGAVALLWMVISTLGRVEASFNTVWGVRSNRSLWRKSTDYLFVVMIIPFLLTAASSMPIMDLVMRLMGHAVTTTVHTMAIRVVLKKTLLFVFGTLAFTFLFVFMPNTKVRFLPALAGGALTAVLCEIWLRLCAMLQIGIVRYSALYGGFAVLPILLIWVFTSWQIILLGAEFVFALQNGDTCRMETAAGRASPYARLLLAIAFCVEAARSVREHGNPFMANQFALKRRISARLTQDVLRDLVNDGILAKIDGRNGAYLPSRDLSKLSVADVARTVLHEGAPPLALGLDTLDQNILSIGDTLNQSLDKTLAQPIAELLTTP